MSHKDGVGLIWLTLFQFEEKEKREIIRSIKEFPTENFKPEQLASELYIDEIQNRDEAYVKACLAVSLRFCLHDTDFAKDILSEEEYEKALNLFERKQYSSRLLTDLSAKFYRLLNHITSYTHASGVKTVINLLKLDIIRQYNALREEQAEKSFSELKRVIEKIASGVKSECYFAAERASVHRGKTLNGELNEFLKAKYGYNLNEWNICTYEFIFNRALIDSDEFWKEHGGFDVFAFINSIYSKNDITHAQKVLSYIFDNIKKDEIGAKLIERNLPLGLLLKENFLETVEKNLFRIIFDRFGGVYNLTNVREEILCYPLITDDSVKEKLAAGKAIIEELFDMVYPEHSKKVLAFFNAQLEGKEKPYKIGKGQNYTVRDLFLSYTFGYWFEGETAPHYKGAEVYCPDFFSAENTWNRMYLSAYAVSLLDESRQKCYANLFELYYEFFKAVDARFGYKTSFQKDAAGRDNAYAQLKQTLEGYGVNVSDEFKNDYVISLLDRKVALMEESERFPVLEQLGDAVYGLAVAEMMFYQPAEIEDESIFRYHDDYVCANAQVEIARMIGLDKLYLSSLSLSYKNTNDTNSSDNELFVIRQEWTDNDCKLKFLADSLEMIIGTICRDCGYEAAVRFTKRIVKEKFHEVFTREIRWGDEVPSDYGHIDYEYWNRIMPAPFQKYQDYSSESYVDQMWHALNKFMLAYSLGTDNVEERKFITSRHNRTENGDKLYGANELGGQRINYAMYDYLHKGLAYVVEKYSDLIKENYKN